jgi:hypothetical protein
MSETILYFLVIAIILAVAILSLRKYIGRFDNIPEEVWKEYEGQEDEKENRNNDRN